MPGIITGAAPFFEQTVTGFSSTAGSQTGGVKHYLVAPFRGRVLECGFIPTSSAAVGWNFQVDTGDNFASALVSNFTTIISSTLASYGVIPEGQCASALPPSLAYVNRGDAIRFTHSGGATSVIGATVYAVVRRGG